MGAVLPFPAKANAPAFVPPRKSERTVVTGKTGSGKTQLGVWLLSLANFDEQPWIIFDYKRDRLLNSLARVKELPEKKIPDEPGLYIAHLDPGDDDYINRILRDISERENVGVYFDECYEVPDSQDFRRILTQGRSKNIPAICLTQRPVFVPRFVFTESEHLVVFRLKHVKDRQKVLEYIPDDVQLDLSNRLPKYHSRWYNDELEHIFQLGPVPDAQTLIDTIDQRLKALEPDASREWF